MNLENLVEKIKGGYLINKKEALELASYKDKEKFYSAAHDIRTYFSKDVVDTCSIVNARSGLCSQDCAWCSQSAVSKAENVAKYAIIDEQEAVEAAKINHKYGVKRFSLVTASRDFPKKSVMQACDIYKKIKDQTKGELSLCASMGLLDKERLEMLKNADVVHYHINLETSRRFFPHLVTKHSFDDKINTIEKAKEAGLKICSGGIIGMGETMEDRIDMALELQKLGVLSIPINILNPIKGTRLENAKALSEEEVLDTIAVFRFTNPKSFMRFAGGRNIIKNIVEKAFKSGMNALMVGDMLTTIGSKVEEDFVMIKRIIS